MLDFRRPHPTGFEMEVSLLNTGTTINRIIEVPARLRVKQLHMVLQFAMGWRNGHLYELRWGPYLISEDPAGELYDYDNPDLVLDASDVTLARQGLRRDSLLTYLYDFGDQWVRSIRVKEEIFQPLARPRVIGGEGACPPEDVGGVGGYAEFLEAWSDPEHEGHDDMVRWATNWYTPGPFDVAKADERIAKRFPGRRAKGTAPPATP